MHISEWNAHENKRFRDCQAYLYNISRIAHRRNISSKRLHCTYTPRGKKRLSSQITVHSLALTIQFGLRGRRRLYQVHVWRTQHVQLYAKVVLCVVYEHIKSRLEGYVICFDDIKCRFEEGILESVCRRLNVQGLRICSYVICISESCFICVSTRPPGVWNFLPDLSDPRVPRAGVR